MTETGQRFLSLAPLLAFAVAGTSLAWADLPTGFKLENELGTQIGYQYDRDFHDVDPRRFYFLEHANYDLSASDGPPLQFDLGVRGWLDHTNQLSLRSASIAYSPSNTKLTVGFQQIAWGETFGFYIADLVNPRDFRDILLNDISWIRLPVFALNEQVFIGKLTLQGVFTPWAVSQDYYSSVQGTPTEPGPVHGDEYGGRADYLFENGVDLSALYYHHWNRNLAFNLVPTSNGLELTPVLKKVDSFGLTASDAFGNLVLRGDAVYHLDQPEQQNLIQPVDYENQFEAILGADESFSDWVLGAQYQWDASPSRKLSWASARLQWNGNHPGMWIPTSEFFVFRGLGNGDYWLEPKFTWALTANWSLGIQADILGSDSSIINGVIYPLNDRSRVLLLANCRF